MVRKPVAKKGLQHRISSPNNVYFEEVARQLQLSGHELNHLLWEKYNPSGIWVVILATGLCSSLFLWIYDKFTTRKIQGRL